MLGRDGGHWWYGYCCYCHLYQHKNNNNRATPLPLQTGYTNTLRIDSLDSFINSRSWLFPNGPKKRLLNYVNKGNSHGSKRRATETAMPAAIVNNISVRGRRQRDSGRRIRPCALINEITIIDCLTDWAISTSRMHEHNHRRQTSSIRSSKTEIP